MPLYTKNEPCVDGILFEYTQEGIEKLKDWFMCYGCTCTIQKDRHPDAKASIAIYYDDEYVGQLIDAEGKYICKDYNTCKLDFYKQS